MVNDDDEEGGDLVVPSAVFIASDADVPYILDMPVPKPRS